MTPLYLAVREGEMEGLRPLLAAGIDPACQDIRGWTALHYAAWAGHFSQLFQLIGALKRTGSPGESPSPYIADSNNSDKQISPSASYVKSVINLKDIHGWTALHIVVSEGPAVFDDDMQGLQDDFQFSFSRRPPEESHDIARLFLEAGADAAAVTKAGQTPLDLAELEVAEIESNKERLLSKRKAALLLSKAGAQRGTGNSLSPVS